MPRSSWRPAAVVTLVAGMLVTGPATAQAMLQREAPGWSGLHWIDEPLSIEQLRGRVVLVRWWMSGCTLCSATAPVLNELHRRHADDGLVIVGVFHPKPRPRPVEDDEVRQAAAALGFEFPLAVDADWSVLRRWWLDGGSRPYTSVSFLLDREGVVRWIHRGGEYHASTDPGHARCDADLRELQDLLDQALTDGPR